MLKIAGNTYGITKEKGFRNRYKGSESLFGISYSDTESVLLKMQFGNQVTQRGGSRFIRMIFRCLRRFIRI